jgi:hypothetical protein
METIAKGHRHKCVPETLHAVRAREESLNRSAVKAASSRRRHRFSRQYWLTAPGERSDLKRGHEVLPSATSSSAEGRFLSEGAPAPAGLLDRWILRPVVAA